MGFNEKACRNRGLAPYRLSFLKTSSAAEILAFQPTAGYRLQRANDRRDPRRLRPRDRVFWVFLSRLWPRWKDALVIVKPETVIGWHRQGFRLFWKWKSCHGKPGHPRTSKEIRELIQRISRENPLWGAPRIHGELLKLGIDVSQATVTRYMVRHPKPPSQTWRTFLDNHVGCLVSIDFFVVPTATFAVLFVFIVLRHERRRIEHFGVTAHPSADWWHSRYARPFRGTRRRSI
jgi:hypothetical protein